MKFNDLYFMQFCKEMQPTAELQWVEHLWKYVRDRASSS